jgi:Tfp pilus assembly protein PilF
LSFLSVGRLLFIAHVIALIGSPASAQSLAAFGGDLYTNSGRVSGPYTVELTSFASNAAIERTISNPDGKFEFHSVAAGNYTIMVKTEGGDVIAIQDVSSAMGNTYVHIHVAEPVTYKPVNGSVSAITLQHHAPNKAIHEMNAAMKKSRAGDSAAAQEHLRAALQIDPEFSEAHTNLGAEYTRAGKLDLAYAEFESALKTGPKGAMEYCNIAVVALAMRRVAEAEQEARQALSIDSRNPQANYLLGKILASQGHYDEAAKRLKLAAPDIPNANILLEKMRASLR